MKKKKISPNLYLFLAVAFYIAGVLFMDRTNIEPLKKLGVAQQEEYTYTDSDGEEHDGETLIDIKGIGSILTYKDVYFASVPFFILALIFGKFIFGDKDGLGQVMFANCILGTLLIWLTSKGNIISTILFWFGIFAAGCFPRHDDVE